MVDGVSTQVAFVSVLYSHECFEGASQHHQCLKHLSCIMCYAQAWFGINEPGNVQQYQSAGPVLG